VPEQALASARLTGGPDAAARQQDALVATYQSASSRWRPSPLDVRVALIRAEVSAWTDCDVSDPAMGWGALALAGVDVTVVPGGHGNLFHGYNMAAVAERVAALVEAPGPAADGIGPGGRL
jgi:hypothetical protein